MTRSETAPAKVNLALHVVGRRADGYHLLESLVVFADVADELLAAPARQDSLTVTGPFADRLGAGSNLVSRAVEAFRARWPDAVGSGLAIELRKNLPVAAGIGGGSADAAAALRLLAGMAATPIPMPELAELALAIGADVPVCLYSSACEVRGVGEVLARCDGLPPLHVVLANPLVPVVTAEVFRRLAGHSNGPMPKLPAPPAGAEQFGAWLQGTRNDLQAPAVELVPAIAGLIDRLAAAHGCMLARMSGSGATVFGLFAAPALAHQAAHDLRAERPDLWVAAAPLIGARA